ncbi:MAG: carbonic anhydrase/acetyltransferase-like protein (isoleucine patch superfamily) [Chlamydiales bacterium]|jgi:carbonic anhydrase/acetyltransferase-like protein (isoleucine patch superfamily)
MFQLLALIHLALIVAIPGAILACAMTRAVGPGQAVLVGLLALPIAGFALALTAACLSCLHRASVRPGKMLRDLSERGYMQRRLYGLCWTTLYYCKFVYYGVLVVPPARGLILGLFGYRGSADFTIYPDTWIRDLPLLEVEAGAYLSNRATIGTNVVLSNGRILVDRVKIGANAVVGHLAMVGPGVVLERGAEIGVGAAIGFSSHIGERAKIGPKATIEHGVRVGAGARVGTASYVGNGCIIDPGVIIPPGSVIPARTKLSTSSAFAPRWQPAMAV